MSVVPKIDRQDAGVLLMLCGAFLMLVGAFLIWPPLTLLLMGAGLIATGRRF